MKMNKLLGFSIAFLLCLCAILPCLSAPVHAEDIGLPEPPEIEGVSAVYFFNMTSDKVIKSENETLEVNTSTSAKVMMGLLACEMLGDRLGSHIQVTEEMLNVKGVKYGFKAEDSVLISDLLYAAICGSYNDAAYIVAYAVSGNVENFVTLMNKRAHELGAIKTYYTNPIGYPDNASMVTTASDTAKIAAAAFKNSLYMEICSANNLQMSDGKKIHNRNLLVSSYHDNYFDGRYYNENCLGMNVGYSGEAGGWSIITAVQDGDQAYLCIILGGKDEANSYAAANELVDWVLGEYVVYNVFKKGKEIGLIEIGLTGMTANQASYVTATDLNVYIQKDIQYHTGLLETKIEVPGKINAPVSAGDKVGELKVYYEGRCVGKCDLVLVESYKQNPILAAINKVSEYLHSRAFVIAVILAVILIPCAIIIVKRKHARHKYTR